MSNFGVYYRGKKQKEAPTEARDVNEDLLQSVLITSDDLAIYASYVNLLSSVVDLASLYLAKHEELMDEQGDQENDSSSPNAAT